MTRTTRLFQRHALAAAVVLSLAGTAYAQVSSATVKGQVTQAGAAAPAGLVVTAVNLANGNTTRTVPLADGSYVLTGLTPGNYEIRITGPSGTLKSEPITLQVGETAALDLAMDPSATTANKVVIVGSASRQGVKDSQVGTFVSRKMIDSLPQATHNFLSAADLAPGVAFSSDAGGNTKIQAGAQDFDHVNVFIDGVGMKNNVLRGGVSGQDSSRGNPFPQSAIAEYKVLTQNYKAEFDQVSSAAITAVTKSGGNETHGEVYLDRSGTNWRAMSVYEKEDEANGVKLPASSKNEYGFSIGGAITPDQTHYFLAYDGKNINDSRQIVMNNADKLPNTGIVPALVAAQGSQVDQFREHLLFGKLDHEINADQHLALTMTLRRETDRVPEDRNLSLPGNDKNRSNDETRFDLTHEWAGDHWLNLSRLAYEDALWNPHSSATSPFIKYKVSTETPQMLSASQDVIFAGGSPDAQKRGQKGLTLSDDFTYTGLAGHVIKTGVKLKALKYDLSGTASSVDTVQTLIDTTTGQPYYSGGLCTGSNVINGGLDSDQCHIDPALPSANASFRNRQFGIYLQDDWALTRQLELNVGARWDYESNMLNNSYVTPADRVTALRGLDVTRWGITPPPGQTYAQSLAKGGVNIEDYISDGSSRKAFKGALAPRLGASYDVLGNSDTVIYGGWGRSYDRTMANHALDELQKNQQAGGEIWMIRNNYKMPYADQLSIGLRQALGSWNADVALSQIKAKHQFVWFGGNRDANGGWANQSPIDPLWNGPDGFGTLVLGDFVGENRTNALLFKLEKPYSVASGWGLNVAYTYSDAKTTHKEWTNDIFDWTNGRSTHGWNPSTLVEKHRLVVAGVADQLLPWGIALSGKLNLTSGFPRRITDCHAGWDQCVSVEGDSPSFRQFDLGISKDWKLDANTVTVRMDVLNLFNTTNYGGFDDWGGGPVAAGQPANAVGGDNLNLGKPNSVRGDTRTVRLALSYKF